MSALSFIESLLAQEGERIVRELAQELDKPFTRTGASGPFTAPTTASGSLKNGLRYELGVNGDTVSLAITAPAHWKYADQGRKAGGKPPIGVLMQWIKDKGISKGSEKEDRSFAFAIARTIERRGTAKPPSRFATRLIPRFEKHILTRLQTLPPSIFTTQSAVRRA